MQDLLSTLQKSFPDASVASDGMMIDVSITHTIALHPQSMDIYGSKKVTLSQLSLAVAPFLRSEAAKDVVQVDLHSKTKEDLSALTSTVNRIFDAGDAVQVVNYFSSFATFGHYCGPERVFRRPSDALDLSEQSLNSLDLFIGNCANRDAVFYRLTGTAFDDLEGTDRMAIAERVWGSGTKDIPYPLLKLRDFINIPYEKHAQTVLDQINISVHDHNFLKTAPRELFDEGKRALLETNLIHKTFPKIAPGVTFAQVKAAIDACMNKNWNALYFALGRAIHKGAVEALRNTGEYRDENLDAVNLDHLADPEALLKELTGKSARDYRVEAARLHWLSYTDPRIPHPAEEVFAVLGPNSTLAADKARAEEEAVNKHLMDTFGIGLESDEVKKAILAKHTDALTRTMLVTHLPNADPTLTWADGRAILDKFIDRQKVDRLERIKRLINEGAKQALLAPSAKRLKI